MTTDCREHFIQLINLDSSRVILEPKIMFICGGLVDCKQLENLSIRNMFMNQSSDISDHGVELKLAENFKNWHIGYSNLSDFENDLASISSNVVVILESAGALTEFGLFFANLKIRKKLIIILHSDFHNQNSFIKLGLLNPLEEINDESVKVYNIDHQDMTNVAENEIQEIISDLKDYSTNKIGSQLFDKSNRGHQLFLIFQLIELFHALTVPELSTYLSKLGVEILARDLKSGLYILTEFEFIQLNRKSSTNFYTTSPSKSNRVELKFKKTETGRPDPTLVKIETRSYYQQTAAKNQTNRRRIRLLSELDEGITK